MCWLLGLTPTLKRSSSQGEKTNTGISLSDCCNHLSYNFGGKVKSAYEARAYPVFRSMKQLGAFLLPPGWVAGPSKGFPQH